MEKTNKMILYFIVGFLITLMCGAFYNPSGAEAKNQRDLSIGKIGGDVRQLQINLTKNGYNLQPFDGIYGLKTQQAVMDLQKKNHLKPTGIFDKETRMAMADINRKSSRPGMDDVQVSRGVSRQDLMTLARVVNGEARGEPFEGQVAVAAVILNRTHSGIFPSSINGVVYEPGAFDAVSDGQVWLQPNAEAIRAAKLALEGYDPTGDAIYYWNPAKTTNAWIWSRPIIKQIGRHVFAR